MSRIVVLLIICGICPHGGSQSNEPSASPDESHGLVVPRIVEGEVVIEVVRPPTPGRTDWGANHHPDTPVAYIGMPAPITADEVNRWIWRLGLSEPQSQFLLERYEEYLAAEQELHEKHVQPLWDMSEERERLHEPTDYEGEIERNRVWRDLYKQRRPLAFRLIVANEDRFLDSMLPCLGAEQVSLLDDVRLDRKRTRVFFHGNRVPGSTLDLTILAYSLTWDDPSPPRDVAQFRELMTEYSRFITPLFVERQERMAENAAEAPLAYAQGRLLVSDRNASTDARAAAQVHFDSWRGLNRRVYEASLRIAETNQRFLPRFLALLDPPASEKMKARYEFILYPPVYPNQSDVSETLARVEASLRHTRDERLEEVTAIRYRYDMLRRALDKRMVDCYGEWKEHLALKMGYSRSEKEAFHQAMNELQQAREGNALVACEEVMRILKSTNDDLATLVAAVESRMTELSELNFDPEGDHHFLPGGFVYEEMANANQHEG